jgi:hypothetical protein
VLCSWRWSHADSLDFIRSSCASHGAAANIATHGLVKDRPVKTTADVDAVDEVSWLLLRVPKAGAPTEPSQRSGADLVPGALAAAGETAS